MTTDERALTDFELDRLLGRWFAEGPETVGPHVAERAVAAIATTRQVGHGRLSRPSRRVALAWAAILVALSVIAASLAGGSVRDEVIPSPPPTPEPSSVSGALVMFRDASAGYQFLMPRDWTEVETQWTDQGTRRFVAPDEAMSVTVSYGTTEGGGGEYVECEPWPWAEQPLQARCAVDGIRYHIPFDPEESVAHLPDTLQPIDGGPLVFDRSPTTLDGATASRLVRTLDAGAAGARTATYVMSIHDFRPIVLFWDSVTERADPALIERMRASFQFLSGLPAQDPMALVPFRDPAGRYELLVPAFWQPADAIESAEGGQARGFAGKGGDYLPLTVRIGGPDGAYRTCATTCGDVTVTSLTDLDDAIVASPNEIMANGPDTNSATTLGGEPAHIESADFSGGQAWGPPAYYVVYTIHDGRAIVLTFDHWAIVMDILPRSVLDEIVASFRFLDDEAASADLVRYTDPEGLYAISLPPTWTPRPVLRSGATIEEASAMQFGTAVDREYGALTISIGRPDGSIELCQGSNGGIAYTFCRDLVIDDLEALADVTFVRPENTTTSRVVGQDTVLGGVPARREQPSFSHEMFGPESFQLVYAIHDGRPVVLAFDHWTIRSGHLDEATLRRIARELRVPRLTASARGGAGLC